MTAPFPPRFLKFFLVGFLKLIFFKNGSVPPPLHKTQRKTKKKSKCPPCSLTGKTLVSHPVVCPGRHLCPPCSLTGKTLVSPPVVFTGRHLWPRPKQDLNTLAQTYDELTFKAVVVKMASSPKRQTSHASGGKMVS